MRAVNATGMTAWMVSEVVGGACGYPQSVGDHACSLGCVAKRDGAYPELDFFRCRRRRWCR